MKGRLIIFLMVVLSGIGWADHQVRGMYGGEGRIAVYGWQAREDSLSGIWMGRTYPIVEQDQSGDVILTALGIGYNLSGGGREVKKIAEAGYRIVRTQWKALEEDWSKMR